MYRVSIENVFNMWLESFNSCFVSNIFVTTNVSKYVNKVCINTVNAIIYSNGSDVFNINALK